MTWEAQFGLRTLRPRRDAQWQVELGAELGPALQPAPFSPALAVHRGRVRAASREHCSSHSSVLVTAPAHSHLVGPARCARAGQPPQKATGRLWEWPWGHVSRQCGISHPSPAGGEHGIRVATSSHQLLTLDALLGRSCSCGHSPRPDHTVKL